MAYAQSKFKISVGKVAIQEFILVIYSQDLAFSELKWPGSFLGQTELGFHDFALCFDLGYDDPRHVDMQWLSILSLVPAQMPHSDIYIAAIVC